MKKIASLVLVVLMMLAMFAVPAYAETVTAMEAGFTNIPFSNGYTGYCIDHELAAAKVGETFAVASTSIAQDNISGNDISQKLKILFTQFFDRLYEKQGDTYVLKSYEADSLIPFIIYHYSDDDYFWGEQQTIAQEIDAYNGPKILDTYQLTVGDDIVSFHFIALAPTGNNAEGRQTFFAYRLDTRSASVAIDYKVTFNANTGSGSMVDQPFDANETDNLYPNLFTKDDYEFIGWNTEPDGSGTSYGNTAEITVNQNITLYAQWKKKDNTPSTPPSTPVEHTVTFLPNGGNGNMNDQIFGENETKPLTPNSFTKDGYEFIGWVGSDGNTYTDGQNISPTTDITLTAQWKEVTPPAPVEHTVTFLPNGGNGNMNDQIFGENETKPLTPNAFTKDGYEFTGWVDSDGNTYTDGQNITPTTDITLTAQWKEVTPPAPEKHLVTFDPNCDDFDGSMDKQEFEHDVPEALNPNEFEREGYEFIGWNTEPDGSGKDIPDGQTIRVTSGDVTLYAQWEKKEVTPPVNPDGDDPFNPGDGEVGDQEPAPEFPATGDASAPMLWLAMFALSIFGFIQMRRKAATR